MEHLKKIGKNNVEVYTEKTVRDINNVDYIILEYKESYGQEKIDEELELAQKDLAIANAFDAGAYKASLIDDLNLSIGRLEAALTLFNKQTIKDKDGVPFEIYDPLDVEMNLINSKQVPLCLEEAKQSLTSAENINTALYKQTKIDKAQLVIDRLSSIQEEMDS